MPKSNCNDIRMDVFIMEKKQLREKLIEKCLSKLHILRTDKRQKSKANTVLRNYSKCANNYNNNNSFLKVIHQPSFLLSKIKGNSPQRFNKQTAEYEGRAHRIYKKKKSQEGFQGYQNKRGKHHKRQVTVCNVEFDEVNQKQKNNDAMVGSVRKSRHDKKLLPFRLNQFFFFEQLANDTSVRMKTTLDKSVHSLEKFNGINIYNKALIQCDKSSPKSGNRTIYRSNSAIFQRSVQKKTVSTAEVKKRVSLQQQDVKFTGWEIDGQFDDL